MFILADMARLFFHDCRLRLIKAMEFRLEFFGGIVVTLIFSCSIPLFQFLIYQNTRGYPGWSFDEIMLFQAVLLLWMGITDTLFGDIKPLVEATIQYGLFDRFLVFPYPPIVVIFTRGFNYRSLGTLLAGIITLSYAMAKLHLAVTWEQAVLCAFFFLTGILFYLALLILYCTLALRLEFVIRLSGILDKIIQLGYIPAEIFSGALKGIYLSVLPFALWINFPVRILLGRLDMIAVFSICICVMLFIFALYLWNRNLKKYASAGG